MQALPHSGPPTLQLASTDPRLCWRLLDTHGQVWLSLLWGHCSFLLGPVVHKVLFVPSKSLLPQCCVSSVIKSHWPPESNSLGCSQSLCQIPRLGNLLWVLELSQQCENILGIIVLRFVCLCGGSGSWCTQGFVWALQVSGGYWVWFKLQFCPSYHFARASPLPLDVGYLFFACIQKKWASLRAQLVKNLPAVQETPVQFLGWEGYPLQCSWLPCWLIWERIRLQCGRPGFDPWVGRIPWRRERPPTSVFWPGEFWPWTLVHGVTKSQIKLSNFHSFFTSI